VVVFVFVGVDVIFVGDLDVAGDGDVIHSLDRTPST